MFGEMLTSFNIDKTFNGPARRFRPGQMAVEEVIYYNNITHIMYLRCLRPTAAHAGDKIIIIISSYYYYKTSWRPCARYCRRTDSSLYDVIIIMISYAIMGRANRIICQTGVLLIWRGPWV